MSNKFLGIGKGTNSFTDGTADLNINALTIGGLDVSQPVKTNSVRQLVSEKLSISDILGLQEVLNSSLVNPMITNLNMSNYNIQNTGTISNSSSPFVIDIANNTIDSVSSINSSGVNLTIGGNVNMGANDMANLDNLQTNSIQGTDGVYGLVIQSDMRPDENGLWELGGSDRKWVEVYTETLNCNTLMANTGTLNTITLSSSIEPLTTSVEDLGSSSKIFRNIYNNSSIINNLYAYGSSITLYNSILPNTTNTLDIGSSSLIMNNIFTDTTQTNYLSGIGGSSITTYNSIIPSTANDKDLGSASNYYRSLYLEEAHVKQLWARTGSIDLYNSIVPNTTNTKNLGSITNYFKDTFTDTINTNTIDGIASSNITLSGNLNPDNNNTRYLGNSNLVYRQINTREFNADVSIMIRPYNNDANRVQFIDTYVRPITDNKLNLGLASNRWKAVYAVNGTIQTSSRTQKKNITECMMGLDFIMRLNPKMYHYNEDDDTEDKRCGLIYEDVEEVVQDMNMPFKGLHKTVDNIEDPDTGEKEEKIGYGIHYESFIPILINTVKELKAEIETLKQQINNISP